MQAQDNDDGCDGGCRTGNVVDGAGVPSGPGGPMSPGDWGNTEAGSAAPGAAPADKGASLHSGQAAEVCASDRHLESEGLEFTLTVPFLSYLDAEVARRCLTRCAEANLGTVHWEFTVTGRDLFIRLNSEDLDLLEISAATMLKQLYIVVKNMQHIVPPSFC